MPTPYPYVPNTQVPLDATVQAAPQYTDASALVELNNRLGGNTAPVLSAQQLTDILTAAKRPDFVGYLPGDPKWYYTIDLNYAAYKGWQEKLALVVGGYDFTADGSEFKRSQVFDQCKWMVQFYAKKVTTRISLPKPVLPRDTPPPVVQY